MCEACKIQTSLKIVFTLFHSHLNYYRFPTIQYSISNFQILNWGSFLNFKSTLSSYHVDHSFLCFRELRFEYHSPLNFILAHNILFSKFNCGFQVFVWLESQMMSMKILGITNEVVPLISQIIFCFPFWTSYCLHCNLGVLILSFGCFLSVSLIFLIVSRFCRIWF